MLQNECQRLQSECQRLGAVLSERELELDRLSSNRAKTLASQSDAPVAEPAGVDSAVGKKRTKGKRSLEDKTTDDLPRELEAANARIKNAHPPAHPPTRPPASPCPPCPSAIVIENTANVRHH